MSPLRATRRHYLRDGSVLPMPLARRTCNLQRSRRAQEHQNAIAIGGNPNPPVYPRTCWADTIGRRTIAMQGTHHTSGRIPGTVMRATLAAAVRTTHTGLRRSRRDRALTRTTRMFRSRGYRQQRQQQQCPGPHPHFQLQQLHQVPVHRHPVRDRAGQARWSLLHRDRLRPMPTHRH